MSFMDAREHGVKPGTGFVSEAQANADRRERESGIAHVWLGRRWPAQAAIACPVLFARAGAAVSCNPPLLWSNSTVEMRVYELGGFGGV